MKNVFAHIKQFHNIYLSILIIILVLIAIAKPNSDELIKQIKLKETEITNLQNEYKVLKENYERNENQLKTILTDLEQSINTYKQQRMNNKKLREQIKNLKKDSEEYYKTLFAFSLFLDRFSIQIENDSNNIYLAYYSLINLYENIAFMNEINSDIFSKNIQYFNLTSRLNKSPMILASVMFGKSIGVQGQVIIPLSNRLIMGGGVGFYNNIFGMISLGYRF